MTAGPGLFISLEGIDGAGKTSHLSRMEAEFGRQERGVLRTREPGGSPLAEKLRTLLLSTDMDGLTEALCMFAARRDHLQRVIVPALQAGQVVLCDRFADASFAYQGEGRGLAWETLRTLEDLVQDATSLGFDIDHALVQPDLTFWLDIEPETAANRLARDRTPDRFEQEPRAFFTAVRQGYQRRAEQAPERIVVIDANRSPGRVWGQMRDALQKRGILP